MRKVCLTRHGGVVKALLQRVAHAKVVVDESVVGEIDKGILIFLGVDKNDTEAHADKLIQKLLKYRVFPDSEDKMNLSVQDIQGGVLVVSQFTLSADTQKGLRPSFSSAAQPDRAERLYNYVKATLGNMYQPSAFGEFGADMKVHLMNDGPVTFLLEV